MELVAVGGLIWQDEGTMGNPRWKKVDGWGNYGLQ
jgi:hypothetical protein